MMTTIRSARSKGSQFEMDCEYSLQQLFPDCFRTHERGYVSGFDLKSDSAKFSFECKRLKGLSWNQAVKFYEKLKERSPPEYECFLLFKSNNQPCLVLTEVMKINGSNGYVIRPFEDEFGPFLKHPPTRQINRKV